MKMPRPMWVYVAGSKQRRVALESHSGGHVLTRRERARRPLGSYGGPAHRWLKMAWRLRLVSQYGPIERIAATTSSFHLRSCA